MQILFPEKEYFFFFANEGAFRTPLGTEEKRINKYEKRRRAETCFQKDGPNADQRKKEREDHIAHQRPKRLQRTFTPSRVSIPALNRSQCIVPDTLALLFKFTNSNTKSWFLNNLGRLLVDRLSVNVQGVQVYQNTGESMMEVYKDLWRYDEDLRQQTGVQSRQRERPKARVKGRQR